MTQKIEKYSILVLGLFDGPLYSADALRTDYRRGIYNGITFCLFAMPVLGVPSLNSGSEEIDGDTADSAVEMSPKFDMVRASEALLDYIME